MSTLSGQASKGEKPKSKFQSLDINSLYKHSRGENLEKTQQKSSLTYVKHGMQSLGKVPSARRPPANLPSLKSEHSGSDAAVPLVPPGAPGWGKQDGQPTTAASTTSSSATCPTGTTTTNSQQQQQQQQQQSTVATPSLPAASPQLSTHQQNIALPVTTTIPPQPKTQQHNSSSSASSAANTDKLWSTVMSGGGAGGGTGGQDGMHPPPYHSAQFQHEFPSLAGDGSGPAAGVRGAILNSTAGGGNALNSGANNSEYVPGGGVSLRPQTEGSWTQGGGRSGQEGVPKNGSGPLAVPPHLSGQAGPIGTNQQSQQQQQTLPPQFRGVMPPFMYKGSTFAQGNVGNSLQINGRNSGPGSGPVPSNRPNIPDNRPPRLVAETEEITPRPIIKEEELNLMDDIGHDMGWAVQDDIDYNQKLEFSDDEIQIRKPRKEVIHKKDHPDDYSNSTMNNSQQNNNRSSGWTRSPTTRGRSSGGQDDDDTWTQQRKHTEKDIELAVQRAIQRREEEEKRFNETTKQGAQKKLQELEEKIQKRQSGGDDKSYSDDGGKKSSSDDNGSSFRALTQIEGKSFPTRRQQNAQQSKESANLRESGGNAPSFSKQFQNDLPPRFRGQRNNPPSSVGGNFNNEGRWKSAAPSIQQRGSPHDDRDEEMDRDRENRGIRSDYKRQSSEDSYRSSHHSQSDKTSHDLDDKLDWHESRRGERPQRPDSRDSRSTRHSRDSEPRDYLGSWSESYESGSYEEKRRDREERSSNRPVPGPITKERIEADDMRSEKRNLTQLKRGIETKSKPGESEGKNDKMDDKKEESTAWADAIPSGMEQPDEKSNASENKDKIIVHKDKDDKDRRDKGRYGHSKGSGWDNSYRSTSYNKSRSSRGHSKPNIGRSSSSISGSGEMHATDSEDDHKKDKDERNRETKMDKSKSEKKENYVPRGEPTRHGRGGGTSGFRSSTNSRMGMSKRIDGYGPPPSKSPFGHSHEEKKISSDEANENQHHHDDKLKQNQQALSTGLQGGQKDRKNEDQDKKNRQSKQQTDRRSTTTSGKFNKSGKKDLEDESDENSDEKSRKAKSNRSNSNSRSGQSRRNPPPRMGGSEKRQFNKKDEKEEKDVADEKDEKGFNNNGDGEGFQEVKSKKTTTSSKKDEPMKGSSAAKSGKVFDKEKPANNAKKLTQQQIQNIPSLMATPVNPPPSMTQQQSQKGQFERPRQSILAPRFARQKMQKQQMQKHTIGEDGSNIKMGAATVGANSGYSIKESNQASTGNVSNNSAVWGDSQIDILNVGGGGVDSIKNLDGGEKNLKLNADKSLLDGSTPPVNTIIFENTNFKSAPGGGNRNNRQQPQPQPDKNNGRKLDENINDNQVMSGFNKTMDTILNKNEKDTIQLPLSFKEDNADMKLDFFDSDLPHLTEDKKNLSLSTKSMQITTGSSTICTADSLNIKIASVKKVWETASEHPGQDEANTSFSNSFDPNTLDPNVFKGTNDAADDSHHEGYSPSPNQAVSTSTNVCKVKPTQQVSGSAVAGQAVLSSSNHQQSQGIVASSGLMGNPLSPPPSAIPPVIGAGVGMAQAPQQYPTNQHIGYQTSLGGNTQYGMSAIPSPPTVPTVLYNSTQQAALQAQTGLYGAFQIDQLGGQGRSQYSQYPNHYGLGQTASSPYSTQSVYLPATPPHPPPPAAQAPPELYPNMSSYRLSATAPFGQNQQLNNPTTVLISSTSNSLMSASVKPTNQPISAIGTKTGGVGQAYQQQSQQGQQVAYMAYDPSIPANYLSNAGVAMQRGPPGPVQNNVVPAAALQSSSYYSGSTGGQTGYFQQPGNSTIPSAPLQQHQAGYGLQGNVFGTHNQSHTNTAGLQNYNSHFLSTPMQMAAAINAQQFRTGLPYMKNVGTQQIGGGAGAGGAANEQNRPQQLKSPSSQEGFSSVFNSGPQIPSPKSKQNAKHPPPQSSPTAQHKYNLYQNVGGHQGGNMQNRFPNPIQRPNVNYQQGGGGGGLNMKHNRNNNPGNKGPNRQYYTNQNLNQGHDKVDDGKLDSNTSNSGSTGGSGGGGANKNTSADIKDNLKKQEEAALKD